MSTDWKEYYRLTKNNPPSPLLVQALEILDTNDTSRNTHSTNRRKALDMGSGNLRDSRYLVASGFDVTAFDSTDIRETDAVLPDAQHFQFIASTFEDFIFPADEFAIVNASFAVPFIHPDNFADVMSRMKMSLISGGIFCGQLFGEQDTWAKSPAMTFHTMERVKALFEDMDLVSVDEKEYDGKIAAGTPKHWHVFHVIAQKR